MKPVFGNSLSTLFAGMTLSLFVCGSALAAAAQAGGIPAESAQPSLVKLLPSGIAKSRTLTVAVAVGSPPDDFRDEKNQIVGWEIDILRAATQSMGLKLDLRPTTFDAVIPGLQAKRFDAAVGQIGITAVREKVVDMVGTLLGNELFAAKAGSTLKIKTLDDLCGHSVATNRGSREYEFASQQQPKCKAAGKPQINVMVFNDGTSAASAMMSGRAELFWLGSTAVSYFVRQSDGRAKVVGSYTEKSYIGVALPKDSGMAQPLQAAIQQLIDDGTYGKIITKWGLQDGAIKKSPLNPKGTAM